MEEPEVIPRREAVIGLGLLGALSLALVATIVFRIVNAAPRHALPGTSPLWAAAPLEPPTLVEATAPMAAPTTAAATPNAPVPPIDDRYALETIAPALPAAAPIPTIEDDSSSVPAASLAPAFAPTQNERYSSGPPPVEVARPRFVPPSGN